MTSDDIFVISNVKCKAEIRDISISSRRQWPHRTAEFGHPESSRRSGSNLLEQTRVEAQFWSPACAKRFISSLLANGATRHRCSGSFLGNLSSKSQRSGSPAKEPNHRPFTQPCPIFCITWYIAHSRILVPYRPFAHISGTRLEARDLTHVTLLLHYSGIPTSCILQTDSSPVKKISATFCNSRIPLLFSTRNPSSLGANVSQRVSKSVKRGNC